MTNKTPIQELIDELQRSNESSRKLMTTDAIMLGRVFEQMLRETLQKEKAFAFDCFVAGKMFIMQDQIAILGKQPDFSEFYSNYVSQHTK